MKKTFLGLSILISCFYSCSDDNDTVVDTNTSISSIRFIGEQIIPDGFQFNGNIVGGLSSIDYANNKFYLISDAPNAPIRVYSADLNYTETEFTSINITSEIELLDTNNTSFINPIDPEALRIDTDANSIIWASEGNINNGENPFIREASLNGNFKRDFTIPSIFEAKSIDTEGPRHNGVFESISLSIDKKGYWVGMELPLKEDGVEPIFAMDTDSPVRIAYINKSTGKFEKQFAYELDKVAREVVGTGFNFTVNGLVELLEYDTNKFLALERSFTTGADDGGNNVKIYKVDASNATDISTISSLKGANYVKATKTLLFDFELIRDQLSSIPAGNGAKVVDNIEGITFGPRLANGNLSIVLVADNNFSAFGQQLNQFVVFEVLP
ncbi:esterase-like activity of phytase family protein [uncultured Tenacibaculum sp.]|uniref:esterase-like activity of phytase family protein n=1 Tax=uncultured Tenacibaculum sp. TaxID=174713 RepID=UPI00262E1B1F|nr:esterase-like activity of phytase family protein [uncultured Tenacibaculum sp.]